MSVSNFQGCMCADSGMGRKISPCLRNPVYKRCFENPYRKSNRALDDSHIIAFCINVDFLAFSVESSFLGSNEVSADILHGSATSA